MPTNYRVLGQLNPVANTLSNVYTVPAATQAVISTITVCNQAATNASYSISISPAGVTDNIRHYIVRGASVPAADALAFTLGITLGNTDQVRCNTNSSNISFSIFGSEIT